MTEAEINQAIHEERCNGCHAPRSEWGPVCPGMTTGDWTHYHSASWWLAFLPDAEEERA